MKKRSISLLMVLAMCLTMMPTIAFAAEPEQTDAGHDHTGWTAWDSAASANYGTTLPTAAGSYYLTDDVTLTDTWNPANGTVLCLNGKTVTGADGKNVINVGMGVTFTLTDCGQNGRITHSENAAGRGVYVYRNGVFNMNAGSITGNRSDNGAGVFISGKFEMKNGEISGNEASDSGAGVFIGGDASFTMNGGTITGNNAGNNGGGVYLTDKTSDEGIRGFSVSGNVKIIGNCKGGEKGDDGLYVKGKNGSSNNVSLTSFSYATEDQWIVITGALGDNASIGVTKLNIPSNDVKIAAGKKTYLNIYGQYKEYDITEEDSTHFSSDQGYNLIFSDNYNYIQITTAHYHGICGKNSYSCTDPDHKNNHGDIKWSEIKVNKNDSGTNVLTTWGEKYYYLSRDVMLGETWKPEDGITLCLNGHKIKAEGDFPAITVERGSTFTLTDCQDSGGAVSHTGGSGRGVLVNGTFNMYGGSIADNLNTGVCVNSGTFNMYGGRITGNQGINGGGVYIEESTFNMYGGTISGNKATYGGGVYANSKISNLTGGEITGNQSAYGGGVFVFGTFNLSGDVNITKNWKNGEKDAVSGMYVKGTNGTANNAYMYSKRVIDIGGALSSDASIGVTLDPNYGDNAFTRGWDANMSAADPSKYFTADADGYAAVQDGNDLKLVKRDAQSDPADTKTETPDDEGVFADVRTGAYYKDAVSWAVKNKITNGTASTTFSPDRKCTRAQIVTFLWRAAGSPEIKNAGSFSDIDADSYYAKAVAWAAENGIASGKGDNKFDPDGGCTRAQVVTFIFRALGSEAEYSGKFSDVKSSDYYAKAVEWAAANGVAEGMGDGRFAPDAGCTRAQIAAFLYRAYKAKGEITA